MTMHSHNTPQPNVNAVNTVDANRSALDALRRHWFIAALSYAAAIAAAYAWLARSAFAAHAASWLIWASVTAAVILGFLWRILPRNRRKGETQLFPDFGSGTWLSLFCGLLLALLAGFLFRPMPAGWLAWVPALLYTVARLLDLWDGYLARRANRVSELGAALDIELDGLGLLIAVALGVQYGRLPVWYLILAVSRQLFVAGMWLLKRRGKPIYDLPPSENRRIIAGFQTGFLTVALWPILSPPLTRFMALAFAIPLVASFGRDWLVVSGVIGPDAPAYLRSRGIVKRVVEGWLPLVARIGGALLGAGLLWRHAPSFAAGLAAAPGLIWAAVALIALALPFFALGSAARLAAVFVIALAFLDISAAGLSWRDNAWILLSGILVAHFGSGYYALWQPEEDILHRRLGDTGPALR
ncbi:MAG: CDP-alcohol phosphatidyltransferase family protein [Chloroflexota bacterium]|nr:CDP-alcohol phosphatidyltransferase family protein [Chloroflexota bacterium]